MRIPREWKPEMTNPKLRQKFDAMFSGDMPEEIIKRIEAGKIDTERQTRLAEIDSTL
ncbi:MAG TPA: hypothetical protein VMI10_12325 [Terriglobales bacterium]|nr:hypothetical protein [Terriglobales bacterium]